MSATIAPVVAFSVAESVFGVRGRSGVGEQLGDRLQAVSVGGHGDGALAVFLGLATA